MGPKALEVTAAAVVVEKTKTEEESLLAAIYEKEHYICGGFVLLYAMFSARLEIAQFAASNSFRDYLYESSIWNAVDLVNIGFLTYISLTALVTGVNN